MDPMFEALTELSIDPFRLDDFIRDPNPLLAGSGIEPGELKRLARSRQTSLAESWSRCAACGDPGADPLPDPDVPPPT